LGVQQTSDLETVFRGVKFTCRFTLKEIEDRWYALLYDPAIAKISVAAMRQLHPDIIAQCHRKALFSEAEEEVLRTVLSNSQPTDETFEELLIKNPEVFLTYRTAKCLNHHWSLMKHYHLLPDQTLLPLPRHEEVISFSDAEEMVEKETRTAITSGQFTGQLKRDSDLAYELNLADRKSKKEIRHLENEIPKWQVLVDSITGVAPSDFDNQTLAVLRGRLVRYLMRSKEITIGRSSKDATVDVDLALEGPANKISRRQGLIKLQPNGDFMIANTGKRPFYVDSKPVLCGANCAKLNNNSVVEISGLRFVFLINQDLIASVRAEALKSQLPS
jgi:microspherule protein 1